MKRASIGRWAWAWMALLIGCAGTDQVRPSPDVVVLWGGDDYLRTHEAPTFHALRPFYLVQATESSCSVATVAMLINALEQMAPKGPTSRVAEDGLLKRVGDADWTKATSSTGDGVTFAAFQRYLRESLDTFGFRDAEIEVFRPLDDSPATRQRLRTMLASSEHSDQDFILAAFDQGVLTGGERIGHISPVGAYDAEHGKVLILDVDRIPPYWSSDDKLLQALLVQDPTDPTGNGLVHVRLPRRGG